MAFRIWSLHVKISHLQQQQKKTCNSAHHKIWKKNLQLNRSCCWMLSSAIVVTGIGWSFVKLCFDWIWYTCHVCDLFFAMLHSCRNQHRQDWFKDVFYTENGPYLFHLLSFVCSFCLLYRSLVSSSVHPCAKNNKSLFKKESVFKWCRYCVIYGQRGGDGCSTADLTS